MDLEIKGEIIEIDKYMSLTNLTDELRDGAKHQHSAYLGCLG